MTSIWMKGRVAAAVALAASLSASGSVMATEGDVGPVFLDSVTALEVAGGGHQAGNTEIKIRGGFTLPTGMTCSNEYLTTLQSTDPNLRMFMLLTIAQVKGKAVRLRITDDPALRAFNGRCSLMWAGIAP